MFLSFSSFEKKKEHYLSRALINLFPSCQKLTFLLFFSSIHMLFWFSLRLHPLSLPFFLNKILFHFLFFLAFPLTNVLFIFLSTPLLALFLSVFRLPSERVTQKYVQQWRIAKSTLLVDRSLFRLSINRYTLIKLSNSQEICTGIWIFFPENEKKIVCNSVGNSTFCVICD